MEVLNNFFAPQKKQNTTDHSGNKFKIENCVSPNKISLLNNGVGCRVCQHALKSCSISLEVTNFTPQKTKKTQEIALA